MDLENRKKRKVLQRPLTPNQTFRDIFSFKADLIENVNWLLPNAHQNPKNLHHYLIVGLYLTQKWQFTHGNNHS